MTPKHIRILMEYKQLVDENNHTLRKNRNPITVGASIDSVDFGHVMDLHKYGFLHCEKYPDIRHSVMIWATLKAFDIRWFYRYYLCTKNQEWLNERSEPARD